MQSILHLLDHNKMLAEESWAKWWDAAPSQFRLSRDRIKFNDQYSKILRRITREFAVDGLELARWLSEERDAILKDDMFSIGAYVTNSGEFFTRIERLLRDLRAKLSIGLAKPENFVLRGDPGSGKSFLVKQCVGRLDARLVERNLGSYPTIADASENIISATMEEFEKFASGNVVLFIDEADTAHNGIHLFQSFIAAMNGEQFTHEKKQCSFSKKNLVIFYAMSSGEKKWRDDPNRVPQKWVDFTERVGADHWIEPPSLGSSAGERVFRAIGLINGIKESIEYAEAKALFYIGWKEWKTTREMELALRQASTLITPPTDVLKLTDVAVSPSDVDLVGQANAGLIPQLGHPGSLWTFGNNRKIRIRMQARWYMAGTEGTGEYVVVLRTHLGRVGYRDLNGSYHIRVEPELKGRDPLAMILTRSSGWKQPGDQGQERYSTVVHMEQLFEVFGSAVRALEPGERGAEVNPSAPEWAQDLVEQARIVESLPEAPSLTVIKGKEFLIQISQHSPPIRLPMQLPPLEAAYGKRAITNLKYWKRIHTLAEQSFRDFRNLHLKILTYQRSEDDSHRWDAALYLKGVWQRFGKFSSEVGGFPKTVREAQPIPLALQIHQCFNVLTKSLAFGWNDKKFQDGVHLIEWSCDCLLKCLTRSDAVLDKAIVKKSKKPGIFISYAWGDNSSEDARKRTEVVTRLCETLEKEGWKIIRDTKAIQYGDLISAFMMNIGLADNVIVVLSDKYLRSPYCMTELHSIYLRSVGKKKDFLSRIIPLVLADAQISTPEDRSEYARHWETRYLNLKSILDYLAVDDFRLYQNMKKWCVDVGNMLVYVNDVLVPYGFDDIVKDDFATLREMLSRRH